MQEELQPEPNANVEESIQNSDIEEDLKESQTEPDQPQYDEYGGYYDDRGYYIYKNGTYYDDKGNYFDEFGGHYDAEGNYFPPQETIEQPENNEVNQHDNLLEQTTENQPQIENETSSEEEFPIIEISNGDQDMQALKSNDEQIPKRKRGRPRKIVPPQEDKQPKKRGRPKKTESSSPTPAKKRGRPKKVQSESEQSPKQAKKRGRPRKTQDSLDEIKRLNEQILEENLKLQRQQAELNNALGITLSQLDNTETSQSDNPSIDNVQDSVQTTENNDDNK